MKTILEVIQLSADYLEKKGIQPARRQAEEILADGLGITRMDLYMQFERPLNPEELQQLRDRIVRRGNGEPVAYIHGSVKFLDCVIQVNPQVLIPRQETEILADKIVQEIKKETYQDKVLWDLCTGSGCLAISIKKKLPELEVYGIDICSEALDVSKKNSLENAVAIQWIQGDLTQPMKGQLCDYLVCNPPYITNKEFLNLDPSVGKYEPKKALVSGPTGIEFYKRLAEELPKVLRPGGKVWFELGTGQGSSVLELFNEPIWKTKRVEKDWAGHDRFFFLELS